jgi:hypothetical protein
MAERKSTRKFAARAEEILSQQAAGERPQGLADLMGETHATGLPASRLTGKPVDNQEHEQARRVRLEVRIPEDLSEDLREYVHAHRTSKAQVVTEALQKFLAGERSG